MAQISADIYSTVLSLFISMSSMVYTHYISSDKLFGSLPEDSFTAYQL
jgi:hypothetical protein